MEIHREGTESQSRSFRDRAKHYKVNEGPITSRFKGRNGQSSAVNETLLHYNTHGPKQDPGIGNLLKRHQAKTWCIGIVGLDRWGRSIMRRFQEQAGTQVLQVADEDPNLLEHTQKRHPELSITAKYRELVENKDLDAVIVATPIRSHASLIGYALEAKKHVLVRRMIAPTTQESLDLIQLARQNNRILSVANEFIFTNTIQKAKQQMTSEGLGKVLCVNASISHPEFLGDKNQILQELVSSEVAILNYLFDSPPDQVSLTSRYPPSPTAFQDTIFSFFQYQDTIPVNLILARSTTHARQITIIGENKTIFLDSLHEHNNFRLSPSENGQPFPIPRIPFKSKRFRNHYSKDERLISQKRLADHFFENLNSGTESPVNGFKSGLALTRTIESMERSFASEGKIEWVSNAAVKSRFSAPPTKIELQTVEEKLPDHVTKPSKKSFVETEQNKLGRKRPKYMAPVYRLEEYQDMVNLIKESWSRGEGFWIASKQLEWLANRLKISDRTADGLPKIWFGPGRRGKIDRLFTRGMDLLLVFCSLTLGLPLWFLLGLFIKLDGGPVFYISERVGKKGKAFKFIKFRSMGKSNDDSQQRKFMKNIIMGAPTSYTNGKGKPVTKNPRDERITWIGRFLRKTSLDEYPQFLHVLFNQMSVVGPRPPVPYEVDCYKDWMKARLHGRGGITGLWQVNGRNEVTFEDQLILDVYYIANRSFWMDLKIVVMTPHIMITGSGAY